MIYSLFFLLFLPLFSCSNVKKHILLIISDDQGISDIGYNDKQFSTPILDNLALNGIKINRMYTATTCSPSRSVLLTGKNVNRVGVQDGPFVIGEGRALSLNFTLLPEYLRQVGYRTVGLGKWHQGMSTISEMPLNRGFDEYFGTLNGALDFMTLQIGNECNSANPVNPDDLPILWGSNCYAINGFDVNDNGRPALEYKSSGKHYTQILGEKAVEKILSHDINDKPLFLYMAPTAPHSPLVVTGEEASRCNISPDFPPLGPEIKVNRRSLICQLMAGLDNMIGDVINALQIKNMLQDTIIFYLSDNGGIKLFGSTNNNLRGQKGSYYEGGVRVPFFVSTPLLSPEFVGTSIDQLVYLTDIYATIATIAGVPQHILEESDGKSFLKWNPSISTTSKDGYFTWNPNYSRDKVYLGGAGNVMGIGSNKTGYDRPSAAVVYLFENRIWKYTDFPNSQAFYGAYEDIPDLGSYLFDLTNDPLENNNLHTIALNNNNNNNNNNNSIYWNALQLGLKYTEDMYNEGIPSPVDHANPPKMITNLIPNKYGCWIPPDSPYSNIDCGLGNQVHDFTHTKYLLTMSEMVDKRLQKKI